MRQPSPKTLNLLLEYEVGGGEKYYLKHLSRFTWPGGQSGPTIGIGIDTAYYSAKELADIFNFLKEEEIELIQGATGKTGVNGKLYTKVLSNAGIVVPWPQAMQIFKDLTWPKFSRLAEKTFPGLEELKDDAYGAIVSLVFNRGTSLRGDSRIEMRNLKTLIPKKDYASMSKELIKMKRIWMNQNLDGLLKRRDAEAALISECV